MGLILSRPGIFLYRIAICHSKKYLTAIHHKKLTSAKLRLRFLYLKPSYYVEWLMHLRTKKCHNFLNMINNSTHQFLCVSGTMTQQNTAQRRSRGRSRLTWCRKKCWRTSSPAASWLVHSTSVPIPYDRICPRNARRWPMLCWNCCPRNCAHRQKM